MKRQTNKELMDKVEDLSCKYIYYNKMNYRSYRRSLSKILKKFQCEQFKTGVAFALYHIHKGKKQ